MLTPAALGSILILGLFVSASLAQPRDGRRTTVNAPLRLAMTAEVMPVQIQVTKQYERPERLVDSRVVDGISPILEREFSRLRNDGLSVRQRRRPDGKLAYEVFQPAGVVATFHSTVILQGRGKVGRDLSVTLDLQMPSGNDVKARTRAQFARHVDRNEQAALWREYQQWIRSQIEAGIAEQERRPFHLDESARSRLRERRATVSERRPIRVDRSQASIEVRVSSRVVDRALAVP